jgi:hypothetical protein
MSKVKPKAVTIQLAMAGATMKPTHVGIQTLCLWQNWNTLANYDKSILCQGTESGFIGRQCINQCGLSRVLDKVDAIAGIYPVSNGWTINEANSFPFVSEYSGACSIFEPNQLTHQIMQNYRVTTYGIEDWDTARTNVFA